MHDISQPKTALHSNGHMLLKCSILLFVNSRLRQLCCTSHRLPCCCFADARLPPSMQCRHTADDMLPDYSGHAIMLHVLCSPTVHRVHACGGGWRAGGCYLRWRGCALAFNHSRLCLQQKQLAQDQEMCGPGSYNVEGVCSATLGSQNCGRILNIYQCRLYTETS